MKALRGLAILVLGPLAIFLGFNRDEIEKRAEEIRKRNAQTERESIPIAARKVRQNWLVQDGYWFGRLPDGSLVRLEAPEVKATTLKHGRPYCCRWYGKISIKADRWQSSAVTETKEPFAVACTVLVQDSKRIEVLETSGPEVTAPSAGEAYSFQQGK
jgi:hypothetical protein